MYTLDMIILIIFLLTIFWLTIGISGFLYWWKKDNEFKDEDVNLATIVSIVGPFTWIIGLFIQKIIKKEQKNGKNGK
jgi:hypothetical protein